MTTIATPGNGLRRTRDGRVLCAAHARTGAPIYHTEGCEACAAARAKGIVRPDVNAAGKKRQRGRGRFGERWIDWDRVRKVRARVAAAIVQDCPPELDACESCRVPDCTRARAETCERRRTTIAGR